MGRRNLAVNSTGSLSHSHGIRPLPSSQNRSDWGERAVQRTWRTLGALCVAIGLINAFIPVLPTTVFLLLGVWAYGKGDPALRQKMLHHPKFGNSLRLWVEQRQISRKGKIGAILGIAASGAITAAALGTRPLMWAICGGLAVLTAYLATRPEPAPNGC